MKNKILSAVSFACALLASGCVMNQAEASATFIAAEATTAAILKSNPKQLPTLQLIVNDWSAFQGGKLTSADEAALLKQIVATTGSSLNDPVKAALLDGAVQQVLANQNSSAPTPLSGAAAAAITDVVNGVARELAIYVPPTALLGTPNTYPVTYTAPDGVNEITDYGDGRITETLVFASPRS